MENMATAGFITAGLAVLALLRLLVAFRELRAELLKQRAELAGALERITDNEAALERVTDALPDLAGLLHRIEQAEKRALTPRYEEAARLARGGAADGSLATRCGLSRGEAHLVRALWRSDAVSNDRAATG